MAPSALLDEICNKGTQLSQQNELFQYAVSIVFIAAVALLRRCSLLFADRGELRDLPSRPEWSIRRPPRSHSRS